MWQGWLHAKVACKVGFCKLRGLCVVLKWCCGTMVHWLTLRKRGIANTVCINGFGDERAVISARDGYKDSMSVTVVEYCCVGLLERTVLHIS
jgi:hypothetical protein